MLGMGVCSNEGVSVSLRECITGGGGEVCVWWGGGGCSFARVPFWLYVG